MAKYKVIVTARSFGKTDSKARELLEEDGCSVIKLEEAGGPIYEQLKNELPDADAVIAGLDDYDERLLARGGKLKVISRYGVGYDRVDVGAASKFGIKVTVTPGANGDSVADLAVGLMLAAARNIPLMDAAMRAEAQKRPQGVEMFEKTLGVVGAGRIGQGVARRCRGFGMKILCYDVYQNEAFKDECRAEYVSFERLIRESDFITIHSPLTEETKNMFGEREFAVMKRDAIIVNTARGGIIDERALCAALRGGVIRGAALDATVSEPPYGEEILTLPNCIVTPHAGAATKEASAKMSLMSARNVLDVLTTGECKYAVN
ncbi:phosphoglycerate dehydrogenase [Cloacibacillus evryensis]|uniref:phosphoglycerate dehydrogenase n=1 Tax=Cloacibacillus evryensis TaxID=508460 RepID=UPI000451CF12|nr:phosphoglycerate dehydrogenase [Cloacibacillus evryensis]EXG78314.1 lactate dehydrogenase-like oxidoreductase [Cloacibacillus evryensis DSM 19522]MEA5035165.1 phosphoglycerate dehydrogenase [Cloacibacillus evryensis]